MIGNQTTVATIGLAMMVVVLLNIRHTGSADAADALAVAICHAHHDNRF